MTATAAPARKTDWTKDEIIRWLDTKDGAVDKAILALYRRQTADEQQGEYTRYKNQRGFMASCASKGCYFGKWVESGRRLSGHHLDKAREIAKKHAGQLARMANGED